MADRTYPAGVPCWIDTEPADVDAALTFYAGLFGWTFENAVPPEHPGDYLIAHLDGEVVAAIASPEPGSTGGWNTYIAVDDADGVVRAAVAAGATLAREPEDVGPPTLRAGRWAEIVDPVGAKVRLWHAGTRLGAQVVNAPGSWNFSDLHTADPVAARGFYEPLFGWEADDVGGGAAMWRRPGYGAHLAATSDPDIVGRQHEVDAPPGFEDAIAWAAPLADGEPVHWHVTFAVADRDDAVATALRLGAEVVSGPEDNEWTRSAVVREPQGAVFTLSQFAPQ